MFTCKHLVGTTSLALTIALLNSPSILAQQQEAKPEDGIEVQARGPVHEAYAQPFQKNAAPAPVVPKKPPAPIPEEPPAEKPKGEDVTWIPGYWGWDTDKNDFLWISGFWRVPPPDRKWVPGHWAQVNNGWQWVSGLWSAANANLQYVPEPPPSVDNGPSVPAPDDNSFYVPGTWQYRNSSYAWRPGYWYPNYSDWVWNPSYYSWTPSGYCYVNGYWDYPLANRGLLFAPVFFNRPLWQNPGWFYRPAFALGFDGLFGSLFARRGFGHYYFGDYYDPYYARNGFWPWYSWGRNFHDPLFSYYNWANRGNPNWYAGLRNNYWGRRNGDLARPQQTFALHGANGIRPAANAGNQIVTPLNQLANRGVPLTRVSPAQLQQHQATAQQFRNSSNQRNRIESAGSVPRGPTIVNGGAQGPGPVITNGGSSRQSFNSGPARQSFYSAPSAGSPRIYQAPAARYSAPPAYRGSSHAMPSFSRPSSSFHGGGSRGGGGGGHGGGGHGGGGHGGGHHK